jgi:hypothetical protein
LELKGRCDSFVVETNVHYPTDINLLWDAMRKIVVLTAKECDRIGISEWRQSDYILKKIKRWFNWARRSYRGKHKEQLQTTTHMAYLAVATEYIERAKQTIAILQSMGMGQVAALMTIEYFIGHGQGQMDQIRRRVIDGATIGHSEKVFSLFESHTEWISSGICYQCLGKPWAGSLPGPWDHRIQTLCGSVGIGPKHSDLGGHRT